jgi:hypothetical protein
MELSLSRGRRRAVTVALVVGTLVGSAGVATAITVLSGPETSLIHGCVHRTNGTMRVVPDPAQCRNAEEPLSWNAEGRAGPPGSQGPQGPQGPRGEVGLPGADGRDGAGLVALEDLKSLPCGTDTPQPGYLRIDANDPEVILRCERDEIELVINMITPGPGEVQVRSGPAGGQVRVGTCSATFGDPNDGYQLPPCTFYLPAHQVNTLHAGGPGARFVRWRGLCEGETSDVCTLPSRSMHAEVLAVLQDLP